MFYDAHSSILNYSNCYGDMADKRIEELVPDIYALVKTKGWFHDSLATDLANNVSGRLQSQFTERAERPTLRLSKMGPRCPCALWYSIHHPELGEPMPPWAEIKFSFGHILEAYIIALVKAAGHSVEGEQKHVELDSIVGHLDCIIDGCIVDVKSCSSRQFIKFKTHAISQSDDFGYLDQLDGYVNASLDDPLVTCKDRGYILAVDKTLGHLKLYPHEVSHDRTNTLRGRIRTYKEILARTTPPPCTCKYIPHGKSGNLQLDTRASYSPFKYCCNPGLRTFIYADGPIYLTEVRRKPDVPEVDRHGNVILN